MEEVKKMANGELDLTPQAEAKFLALIYMGQKSLTDDLPEDIAREYRMVQQKILAAFQTQ